MCQLYRMILKTDQCHFLNNFYCKLLGFLFCFFSRILDFCPTFQYQGQLWTCDPHLVLGIKSPITSTNLKMKIWTRVTRHGIEPMMEWGLPGIKRTLDGRAHDNELPWSLNNLINIYDEQQSTICQSRLWRVHLQSGLWDQNCTIIDMDQAEETKYS